MFWNIYIAAKGKVKAEKRRLYIKEAPDTAHMRVAVLYAAKYYDIDEGLILAIPSSKKDLC